jgi:hypothetical protein
MSTLSQNMEISCRKNTSTSIFGYIRLHNLQNYVTFDEMLTYGNYGKPLAHLFSAILRFFSPPEGLTAGKNRGIFTLEKSCDEDMRFGKILREEPAGARLCHFPIRYHFRAEDWKYSSGCGRYCVNEGQTCLQPGWNRGVHYRLCMPPLIMSGGGIFFIC